MNTTFHSLLDVEYLFTIGFDDDRLEIPGLRVHCQTV